MLLTCPNDLYIIRLELFRKKSICDKVLLIYAQQSSFFFFITFPFRCLAIDYAGHPNVLNATHRSVFIILFINVI